MGNDILQPKRKGAFFWIGVVIITGAILFFALTIALFHSDIGWGLVLGGPISFLAIVLGKVFIAFDRSDKKSTIPPRRSLLLKIALGFIVVVLAFIYRLGIRKMATVF
jgi:Ca2+/Na+ antiporter